MFHHRWRLKSWKEEAVGSTVGRMVLCAAYKLGNLNQNALIAMLIIILARVDISIAEIHSNEKQYVSATGVA
jgi:hypothetical protein